MHDRVWTVTDQQVGTKITAIASALGMAPTEAYALLGGVIATKTPDEILADHQGTCAVPGGEISTTKIKIAGEARNDVVIATRGKEYTLTVMGSAAAVKPALARVGL